MHKVSERATFWFIFAVSMIASIGGLFVSCFTHKDTDAIRGGSLGAAIALAFMFATRDYGHKFYSARTEEIRQLNADIGKLKGDRESSTVRTEEQQLSRIATRVDALAAAIEIDTKGRETENTFLAIATCVGTLVAGFGDLFARYFLL